LRKDFLRLQPVDTTKLLASSRHRIYSGDNAIAFTLGIGNVAFIFRTYTTVPSATSPSLEPTHDRAENVVFQLGVDRC
jgi:hypothetical protein